MTEGKVSKSEIIRNLCDPNRRTSTLEYVFKHCNVRLPKVYLFNDDEAKWKSFIVENGCLRYYWLFPDLRKKDEEVFSAADGIDKQLCVLQNMRTAKAKRIIDGLDIPPSIDFVDMETRVFHLSCIAYKRKDVASQFALLRLLETAYKEALKQGRSAPKHLMRYVLVSFSKQVVLKYIRANVVDMKGAFAFLRFVASKIDGHVVELWFEESMPQEHSFFARLRAMLISPGTCFSRDLFEQLLRHRAFRNTAYNCWNNESFLVGISDYVNRGDYEFYYRSIGVAHSPLVPLPANYQEYEFFSGFDPQLVGSIRQYQARHGHNRVLDMFVQRNIDRLLGVFSSGSMAQIEALVDVLCTTVAYGNRAVNLKIWEELKHKEAYFRRIVAHFAEPVDRVLYNLLTGRHELVAIADAEKYIRFYYEDELIEYFRGRTVGEIIGLVSDWNRDFFIDVLYLKTEQDAINEEDIAQLLDFVATCRSTKYDKLAGIISRLMDASSTSIYAKLDEKIRFIYALRSGKLGTEQIAKITEEYRSSDSIVLQAHAFELERATRRSTDSTLDLLAALQPLLDEDDIVGSLFRIAFIGRDLVKYFFVEYFDQLVQSINALVAKADQASIASASDNVFIAEPTGSGAERIEFYLRLPAFNESSLDFRISFLLGICLRNKYVLYALNDKILGVLDGPHCSMKALVLGSIDLSRICIDRTLAFMHTLVPLVNSSSGLLCRLSRTCLSRVSIENKEVQGIFSDLIQALVDKQGLPVFFRAFRALLFNNYLCFNSLCLILQILFKGMADHTEDVLEILGKLEHITRERDMQRVGQMVFLALNRFVISNHYHTEDVQRVARIYAFYASFDNYLPLIDHLSVLRISLYTVGLLKARCDSELSTRVILHVINSADGAEDSDRPVPYPFIGAACELHEFGQHFASFFDVLKRLFVDKHAQKRAVATKAFQEVLKREQTAFTPEIRESVILFIVGCAVYEDYSVQLNCLDAIECLPLLYIMKNNQHILVRKKAYDMWKARVEHPNKLLKVLAPEMLHFVRFAEVGAFRASLGPAVSEMVVKYVPYLEGYIADSSVADAPAADRARGSILGVKDPRTLDDTNYIANLAYRIEARGPVLSAAEIREFILVEAVRANKLVPLALSFVTAQSAPGLFNALYKDPEHRAALLAAVPEERLIALCEDNRHLALVMLRKTANADLIRLMEQDELLSVLEEWETSGAYAASTDGSEQPRVPIATVGKLVDSVKDAAEAEAFIAKASPALAFLYVCRMHNGSLEERKDCGHLLAIFQRVFDALPRVRRHVSDASLDPIITPGYMQYIKHCSMANIQDAHRLLLLLAEDEDRKSFECFCGLIDRCSFDVALLHSCCAYLLHNYLLDTRRALCHAGLLKLYDAHKLELGYFRSIIENSVAFKQIE
ncbi:hypothetical protein PAPHI01_2326 [Pancytospora philotis]|nr:hypothetical protein PAPHI01_2326 [Pancytospora philotis]